MAYLNGHFPESSVVNVEHFSLVFEYKEHLYKYIWKGSRAGGFYSTYSNGLFESTVFYTPMWKC